MNRMIVVAILTSLLCLGLLGTAFAGERGSEAGIDPAPTAATLAAAENYNYDQAQLAQMATEAGAELRPTSKTLAAAENYTYDQERLARIGTEAGADTWGRDNAPLTCLVC